MIAIHGFQECLHMSEEVFSCMARSDLSWECTNCGLANISTTLCDSTIIDSSTNLPDIDRFNTSCSSLDPGSSAAQSSPSKQPTRSTAANLRSLTINFQSLYGKKEVFWSLVDAVKPDVIFGSETWLKPDMGQSEFFHLASMCTGRIVGMDMMVCYLVSIPALSAIS